MRDEATAPSAAGADTEELGAELRSAIARVYARFRSERAEDEIGDAALEVLLKLGKRGPLSLRELSDLAHVTPGSMSQLVNRLCAGGYAVRGPDPADGRRVLFTLTPEGRAVAAAAREHRSRWLNARLAELTPAERGALAVAATVLRRIADS